MAESICEAPVFAPVYSSEQEKLIQREFSRINDLYYLEHAGATLYSERQISNIFDDLKYNVFGNPHSRTYSSKLSEDAIDQIRYRILQHFNTTSEDYTVIFTSGSTSALKLVGETFDYKEGNFAYLEDNHTSVLGMRENSLYSNPIPHEKAFEIFSEPVMYQTRYQKTEKNSLFVFPAQCNFSGAKYPLWWIEKVHEGCLNKLTKTDSRWFCMLDAASYVSTNFLDLSEFKPDFVCMSFYKIFGYPTGLGALLVKNSSAEVLKKQYFGGGTVFMALSSERTHIPRSIVHENFEDGTLPFLSIISIKHGFDTLKRLSLTMQQISQHTFNLAKYVYDSLVTLHHKNGKPVAVLYHDSNFDDIKDQGGIVNLNLLRANGEYIGYAEVLQIANLYGIQLRTGCFCNPGACQRHLRLTTADIKHHYNSGHVCGDQNDLIDGHPTGTIRISFGYMSTKKDAETFLKMIEECYVTGPVIRKRPKKLEKDQPLVKKTFKSNVDMIHEDQDLTVKNSKIEHIFKDLQIESTVNSTPEGFIEQIFIYPIKSCAAFPIEVGWELTHTGFKYDRQWMIVNANGVCVTQKHDTRLCLIKPMINLKEETLEIHFEDLPVITLPLQMDMKTVSTFGLLKCQSKVCGDSIQGWDCGNEMANWLTEATGISGLRLLRQCKDGNKLSRISKRDDKPNLSLSNEAQYLLINKKSVEWLLERIPSNEYNQGVQGLINRFRPNFVVNFTKPLIENSLQQIKFGNLLFKCDGQCTRCQMICIDQSTGEKSVEPLKTLSKEFNGKISFGMYLSNLDSKQNSKVNIHDKAIGMVMSKITNKNT